MLAGGAEPARSAEAPRFGGSERSVAAASSEKTGLPPGCWRTESAEDGAVSERDRSSIALFFAVEARPAVPVPASGLPASLGRVFPPDAGALKANPVCSRATDPAFVSDASPRGARGHAFLLTVVYP